MDDKPFAYVLQAKLMAELRSVPALERGKRYFDEGRVTQLERRLRRLSAQVEGTEKYAVAIWIGESGLAYLCDCPMGDDGKFCKHCVAVAYAWLERAEEPPSLG